MLFRSLLLVSVGLWRVRRWSRAPAVLAQLFALVVGVPLMGAEGWTERVVGGLLAIMALAAIVGLFLPSSTRELIEGN